jgi:hypothetical protein
MVVSAGAVRLHIKDGAKFRMDCTTSATDDAAAASGDFHVAAQYQSRRALSFVYK